MSMPLPPASGLEVARRLSADGRWQEASDAFARLDAGGGLDADGLAEFAVVSWMAGDFGACLELYGRSYRGHLDRGHHTAAAVGGTLARLGARGPGGGGSERRMGRSGDDPARGRAAVGRTCVVDLVASEGADLCG